MHLCHQMHTAELPQLDHALSMVAAMVARLQDAGCPIAEINTGGGLGEPMMEGETDLDLDAWAAVVARRLGPLGATIATEPGEFFFAASGVLLAEVATVEDRLGTTFVGLNAGWNTAAVRFVWGEWRRRRARRRAARPAPAARDDRRPHQRGARPVRRGLRRFRPWPRATSSPC